MQSGMPTHRNRSRFVRNYPLLALAALICSISLAGCGGGGGSTAGNPGGSLTRGVVAVTVTLPPGVTGATSVVTSLGATPIAGNTSQAQIFNGGPQLARVTDLSGRTLLMGWAGADRTELSANTTAEVLLYFALNAFTLTADGRATVEGELRTRAEVQPLAAAISAALASDRDALSDGNASVRQALETARSQILGGRAARLPVAGFAPSHASVPQSTRAVTIHDGSTHRGVVVNPLDSKSGITVETQGVNNIVIHNEYRRRAYYFVERVSYVPAGGGAPQPSPASVDAKEISPTTGVTSVLGGLIDYVYGNVAYAGVDSQPIALSVNPADAVSTDYKVTVVGFGAGAGDSAGLTSDQTSQLRLTIAKSLMVDFFVPLVANCILPLKGDAIDAMLNVDLGSNIVTSFISAVGNAVPNVFDKAYRGDLNGAIVDGRNALVNNSAFQVLVLDFIYELFRRVTTIDQKIGYTDMAKSLLRVMGGADAALTVLDSLVQVKQIAASNRAETWTVTVNKSRVRLDPVRAEIGKTDQVTLSAVVPDATGPGAPTLTYHWSTPGSQGQIQDGLHAGTDFDSSKAHVTYIPNGYSAGTDTVTVEAFQVDGQKRTSIGTATAQITVRDLSPRIVPDRVSLQKDESQTFIAKIDSGLSDGGRLTYRWFSAGTLGQVTQPAPDAESAASSGTYQCTSASTGQDTVGVEVFSTKNGVRRSLGIARAQVKVEAKKTIFFGHYETKVLDSLPGQRGTPGYVNVSGWVIVPKVPGAKSYSVRGYDFFDPAAYGHEGHWNDGWPYEYDMGSEIWFGISGGDVGKDDPHIGDVIAGLDARFKGMTVELTVSY